MNAGRAQLYAPLQAALYSDGRRLQTTSYLVAKFGCNWFTDSEFNRVDGGQCGVLSLRRRG